MDLRDSSNFIFCFLWHFWYSYTRATKLHYNEYCIYSFLFSEQLLFLNMLPLKSFLCCIKRLNDRELDRLLYKKPWVFLLFWKQNNCKWVFPSETPLGILTAMVEWTFFCFFLNLTKATRGTGCSSKNYQELFETKFWNSSAVLNHNLPSISCNCKSKNKTMICLNAENSCLHSVALWIVPW